MFFPWIHAPCTADSEQCHKRKNGEDSPSSIVVPQEFDASIDNLIIVILIVIAVITVVHVVHCDVHCVMAHFAGLKHTHNIKCPLPPPSGRRT